MQEKDVSFFAFCSIEFYPITKSMLTCVEQSNKRGSTSRCRYTVTPPLSQDNAALAGPCLAQLAHKKTIEWLEAWASKRVVTLSLSLSFSFFYSSPVYFLSFSAHFDFCLFFALFFPLLQVPFNKMTEVDFHVFSSSNEETKKKIVVFNDLLYENFCNLVFICPIWKHILLIFSFFPSFHVFKQIIIIID